MRVDTEELLRALKICERSLSRKGLPFYRVVFVRPITETVADISASNSDQIVSVRVACHWDAPEGQAPEALAIAGEELIGAVAVAPSVQTSLVHQGTETVVTSGSAEWKIADLSAVDPTQAPEHPTAQEATQISADAVALRAALMQVNYAASRSQARPGFMQVKIDEDRVQASDGYRFHEVPLRVESAPGDYLVPVTVLDTVVDVLDYGEGQAVVQITDEWLRVATARAAFTTGKLAYPFPDVNSLIVQRSEAQTGKITVDRLQLAQALKVAEANMEEKVVDLTLLEGELRVSAAASSHEGKMEVGVIAEGVDRGWTRRVNSESLQTMLGKLGGDKLELSINPGNELGFIYVRSQVEAGVERAAVLPVQGPG